MPENDLFVVETNLQAVDKDKRFHSRVESLCLHHSNKELTFDTISHDSNRLWEIVLMERK